MTSSGAFLLEPATIDPIVYAPVFDEAGRRAGWTVGAKDRKRFEQGSGYTGTGPQALPATEPDEKPSRTYLDLVEDLEVWGIGDDNLYRQLERLHTEKPHLADKITAAAVAGAQSGSLHNPTAFLASRLKPKR